MNQYNGRALVELTIEGGQDGVAQIDAARVRLAKCFLATPAFVHEGYAEARHLRVPHAIARRLLTGAVRDDRPVYLSRTRVEAPVAGRRLVRNEAELEARLIERGALVVHMQELTLAEQIALVNRHRAFIGLWGSALHNTLFSLEGTPLSTFTLIDDGRRPVNFLLVDSLVGAASNLHGSLLLVHGTSDDNVHFQNTIQMTDALIRSGKQFRLMAYPGKTHGIGGSGARTQLFHMMEDFWNKELK